METTVVSTPRAKFAMTIGDIRKSGRSIASFIVDECKAAKESINPSELRSWEKSLPALMNIINMSSIPDSVILVCEYELAGGRCDWILIGGDAVYPVVILGENKQWTKWKAVEVNGMLNAVLSQTDTRIHPLPQIRNYKRQVEAIIKCLCKRLSNVKLYSVIYMHNATDVSDIRSLIQPNENIMAYSGNREDSMEFASFLSGVLTYTDVSTFTDDFLSTDITISPDSLAMVKDALSKKKDEFGITGDMSFHDKYSLNDEQSVTYSKLLRCFYASLKNTFPNRYIVAVSGGPGSGKSMAAHTLLYEFITMGVNVGFYVKNRERRAQMLKACRELITEKYGHVSKNDESGAKFDELKRYIKTPTVLQNVNHDVMIFDEAQTLNKYLSTAVVDENGCEVKDERGNRRYETKEVESSHVFNLIKSVGRVAYFFCDEDQKISTKDFFTINELEKFAADNNFNYRHYHLERQNRFLGGEYYCEDLHKLVYEGYDGSFKVRTGTSVEVYITKEYGDLTFAERKRLEYDELDKMVPAGRPKKEGFQIGALWSSKNEWRSTSKDASGYDFENLFMYDANGNKYSVFMNWNPNPEKIGRSNSFMYMEGRNNYVAYTPNMLGNEVDCFYLLIPDCYKFSMEEKRIIVDPSTYGYEANKLYHNTDIKKVMLNELYIMLSRMQSKLILSVEDPNLRRALKYAFNAEEV